MSDAWAALTEKRALTWKEAVLAWLGLGVFCALVLGPNVADGGLYSDDWSHAATSLYPSRGPGFFNALAQFADIGLYRPVLVLYVPVLYWAFGMNMALHLAWAATLTLLVAGFLYGILRNLGVPRIHAWIVAALTIAYPWSDSIKLWATGDQIALGIAFAFAGIWVALVGLSRRSYAWHVGAAVLYLISILAYEITLPLIAVMGGLYVIRVGWREARGRWAMDLGAVAIAGVWVGTQTTREKSGLAGNIEHLEEIISTGGTIVGRSVIPIGPEHTLLGISILLGVLAMGCIAYACLDDSRVAGDGWNLRSWLLLAAGGLAVTILGWVIFIPADPYYTPSIFGVTNRVNGLAGIGIVIAIYGSLGVLGSLLGLLLRETRTVPLLLTFALSAIVGLSYVHVVRRHTQIWHTAFQAEERGVEEIATLFPRLPPGAVLFVSGYPAYQTLGVPIFSASWDVDGMVKTQYETADVSAYPVISGSELVCTPAGVGLVEEGLDPSMGLLAPYGQARLVNIEAQSRAKPLDPRSCRAVVGRFEPGPLYISAGY